MNPDGDRGDGLPIGSRIDAAPARLPAGATIEGRYVVLVPLDPKIHADALWEKTHGEENDRLWLYMAYGPFPDRDAFRADLERKAATRDPFFFATLDKASGSAAGYAALMRVEPAHRSIEVGNILFTPAFQRTRGATEAMYLMARYVFEDLGYRRYEWKCNSLNQPSRRAALRLGFTFEGIFRQHMIVKGRNRDTAWFSMLDAEWPARKPAFERWLHPSNFDAEGRQKSSLSEFTSDATL